MKFHWADFLHREGGHWQMTPNDERGKYYTDDCATLDPDTKIVTVTRDTKNLGALAGLDGLEELTLHETNQGQIDALADFGQITRLRITHARPKTLAALAQLPNVRELVLEYVSGFSDLSPVAAMPALSSLYIENLRAVRDFSPLGRLVKLKYLAIHGTFDLQQPIDSVEFVKHLTSLDFLSLAARLDDPESAKALVAIGDHCEFNFIGNLLPLEIFAYLEAHCANAKFTPAEYWYLSRATWLPDDDPRARLSDEVINAEHPEVIICDDGRRLFHEVCEYDKYHLLGRGGARHFGKDQERR